MVACIREFLSDWHAGERRDIFENMRRLALLCVVRCLFRADLKAEAADFAAGIEVTLRGHLAWRSRWLSLPFSLPTPKKRRGLEALTRLNEIVYRLINEQRVATEDRGDLLSAFLSAPSDNEDPPLTVSEARDMVLTLMAAGTETTATVVSWIWHLLSQHSQVEAKLVAEVTDVLQQRVPTFADLPKLRYAEMVLLESMRLYPPIHLLGREALGACDIAGYAVPAGQTVWMSQWLLHRDPRFFTHPESFDPERWTTGLQERLPRCAYFPFGAGPRACIGDSFAMVEGALIVAMIAQRFRFSPMCGEPIRPMPAPFLRPGPRTDTVLSRRPQLSDTESARLAGGVLVRDE